MTSQKQLEMDFKKCVARFIGEKNYEINRLRELNQKLIKELDEIRKEQEYAKGR